jgi:gluconolactonase
VSLTAEARIMRWPVLPDGRLGEAERFGPALGQTDPAHTVAGLRELAGSQRTGLGYCDGMAFDALGNLWITLPLANRIVMLTSTGRLVPITHDPAGRLIDFPTNLCWSGPDMRQLNVVSRKGGAIVAALTARPGLRLL